MTTESDHPNDAQAPAEIRDPSGAMPTTTDAQTDARAEREARREALVREALERRPELRVLAGKRDFAASKIAGAEMGFEDAARLLTLDQLKAIQALKDRRLARYALHEFPGELRGPLGQKAAGLDEPGFLVGYVDGASEFLKELGRKL
jgi:hypothetical protein